MRAEGLTPDEIADAIAARGDGQRHGASDESALLDRLAGEQVAAERALLRAARLLEEEDGTDEDDDDED